jgi:replication factor A1
MGSGSGADALERRKEIAAIKDESMGLGEKPDYITVKATVNHIKHDTDCWYTACPTEGCNKKVHETLNNNWSCEKCMKEFPQVITGCCVVYF